MKTINVAGMGDVGSNLLLGLKMLGFGVVKAIGIYDLNTLKLNRLEAEANQIFNNSFPGMPLVEVKTEDQLFMCDIFVFCIAKAVPDLCDKTQDVRKVQFHENSKILAHYIKLAKEASFNGIFAIVSDPVDELCDFARHEFKGMISPHNIKGFGLGVMHARGRYIASSMGLCQDSVDVFGPHGQGLIVANSTIPGEYDDHLSEILTQETRDFNLKVRSWGFKPFIAPAMSSGAMSILAMIKGDFNYSTVYTGSGYFGIKNRMVVGSDNPYFLVENYVLDPKLSKRIENLNQDILRIINE